MSTKRDLKKLARRWKKLICEVFPGIEGGIKEGKTQVTELSPATRDPIIARLAGSGVSRHFHADTRREWVYNEMSR